MNATGFERHELDNAAQRNGAGAGTGAAPRLARTPHGWRRET